MGLPEFWEQMCHSPMLMVSTVLTLGVILVNGWTDAPNAIATCVSTRAISARKAIVMAAVFNFLGVLVMTAVNASVAMTIYNMVDFGGNAHISLVALCAAMAAIVIWATAAWYFGIPTSESHALIAGISGAAVAIQNSFSGINGAEWMKVIYGILLSTVLGFAFGFAVSKLTLLCARHCNRIRANRFFFGAQVAGGAAMAFMHGAQDGQKFMAIFLLGAAFSGGHCSCLRKKFSTISSHYVENAKFLLPLPDVYKNGCYEYSNCGQRLRGTCDWCVFCRNRGQRGLCRCGREEDRDAQERGNPHLRAGVERIGAEEPKSRTAEFYHFA